jgi:YfiH family protein
MSVEPLNSESSPKQAPWQSALLTSLPGILHGVTRRVPGMGRADGNVGFSAPRDRADAWAMRQRWCAASGLEAERLVTLGQIHGTVAHVVTAAHSGWGATPGSTQIGLGDALVTNESGPVLMTLHADCQAVIFVDPARNGRGPVVAVAHAGWRGTVANVVGETLSVMRAAFGTRAEDVHVTLGPAIGACCYDVGEEVVLAWCERAGAEAGAALLDDGARPRFSLTAANALLLHRAGVPVANIEVSAVCTRCESDRWFSHRGQGVSTGRFGAMIAIAE